MFRHGGLSIGLAAATAYQCGCLARNPLGMSLRASFAAAIAGLALIVIAGGSVWPLLLALVMVSAAVQSARDALLPDPPPAIAVKRTARVFGFVAGILLGWYSSAAVLLSIVAGGTLLITFSAALSSKRAAPFSIRHHWNPGRLGWTMFFHQFHYFAYCYMLLYHLIRLPIPCTLYYSWIIPLRAALWFAIGWATYIGAERLLRGTLHLPPKAAAVMGHTWAVACLIGMVTCIDHPWGFPICWALGGFGGGSVYAFKLLARNLGCTANMELWEHLGHVSGTALTTLTCFVLGDNFNSAPYIIAIGAAGITLYRLLRLSTSTADIPIKTVEAELTTRA